MAASLDFARELIAAGDRDLAILGKNISDPEIATEVLGFHSTKSPRAYPGRNRSQAIPCR